MPTASGTVAVKSRDGKSIKIEDTWYGAFAATSLSHVNMGDSVTFDYTEKVVGANVYRNIKGAVRVVMASALTGAPPSTGGTYTSAPASSTGTSFTPPTKAGDIPIHTQRAIIRQSSLASAVNLCTKYMEIQGKKPLLTEEMVISTVLSVAKRFEAYASGDADVAEIQEELGIDPSIETGPEAS